MNKSLFSYDLRDVWLQLWHDLNLKNDIKRRIQLAQCYENDLGHLFKVSNNS